MGWNTGKVVSYDLPKSDPNTRISEERKADIDAKAPKTLGSNSHDSIMLTRAKIMERLDNLSQAEPDYHELFENLTELSDGELVFPRHLHSKPENYSTEDLLTKIINDNNLPLDPARAIDLAKDVYTVEAMFCFAIMPGNPFKIVLTSAFHWNNEHQLDGGVHFVQHVIPDFLKQESDNIFEVTTSFKNLQELRSAMKDLGFVESVELLEEII